MNAVFCDVISASRQNRPGEPTMDTNNTISTQWHIPRPSLSSSGSCDSRSRGGSSSSQGSSSNHSTHSASSGSLLLNAAQLARTARHHKEECGLSPNRALPKHTNVVSIPEEPSDAFWSDVKRGSIPQKDATSIASSTHFTVVNGFTKPCSTKEPKTCCCDHSHQITVLVISMTILFSACILAAICFVEMRMRKETGIYKYS